METIVSEEHYTLERKVLCFLELGDALLGPRHGLLGKLITWKAEACFADLEKAACMFHFTIYLDRLFRDENVSRKPGK